MKENDVFKFSYNEEARAKIYMPDHCFDGQLVYRDGKLHDTYCGLESHAGDVGRHFTPAEAEARGTLTFLCNLDDVERIPHRDLEQYEPADRWDLSHQHGCHKHAVVRRGAKKSPTLQREILKKRIEAAKREAEAAMRSAFYTIEHVQETLRKLDAGEEVYL